MNREKYFEPSIQVILHISTLSKFYIVILQGTNYKSVSTYQFYLNTLLNNRIKRFNGHKYCYNLVQIGG